MPYMNNKVIDNWLTTLLVTSRNTLFRDRPSLWLPHGLDSLPHTFTFILIFLRIRDFGYNFVS